MTRKVPQISFVDNEETITSLKEIVVLKSPDQLRTLQIATQRDVFHVVSGEISNSNNKLESTIHLHSHPHEMFENPLQAAFENECDGGFDISKLSELGLKFHKSCEKKIVISSVKEFLIDQKINSFIIEKVLLFADELFTNAIYNAPVQKDKGPICRSKSIQLSESQMCKLRIGVHKDKLAIFCEDRFGSLDCKGYIKHILSKYDDKKTHFINMNLEGGAGIGSFLMYNLCESMYLAVEPSDKTIIGFTIQIDRKGLKQANPSPKQIHISQKRSNS